MPALRCILVAHDFSPHADAALEQAVALGRRRGAAIHLLHAFRLPAELFSRHGAPMPAGALDAARADAQARLDAVAARVRDAGLACEAEVATGAAVETILARADALGADLVALGTRGLTGLRHLLLGTVAARVLREAPCPVLTAHAPDGG